MKSRPHIETELIASVALHSNKGAFALLLGSGISRSAGIPTGWDIVLDLIAKLVELKKENPPDPEQWYRDNYGREPDYSDLLTQLSSDKPAERVRLIERYIKPSADDLAAVPKRRVATPAHHAIASLVKRGVVRVIITTNFDQLMEQALADVGIAPCVIRSAGDIETMIPVQHNECTLLKIHGDYTDPRFRNTVEELTDYEDAWNELLTRIFNEYGLVVCGWSAKWDHKLRQLLISNPGRHFATFWCSRSAPGTKEEQDVITARKAAIVMIKSADSFFEDLNKNIEMLENRLEQPLSTAAAVYRVKEYLSDSEKNKIRLTDFVNDEVNRALVALKPSTVQDSQDGTAVDACNLVLQRLAAIIATLAFWSSGEFDALCAKSVGLLIPSSGLGGRGATLAAYPAIYLLYAIALSCVLRRNFELMRTVLFYKTRDTTTGAAIAIEVAHLQVQMRAVMAKFAVSRELHDQLLAVFKALEPDANHLEETFFRCEYLMGIGLGQFLRANFFPPTGLYVSYGKHGELKAKIDGEWRAEEGKYPPIEMIEKNQWQEFNGVKALLDQYIEKPPYGRPLEG